MTEFNPNYITPPGVDEREVPYPSCYDEAQVNTFKRDGISFINWNGTIMAKGPGMSTDFFDEIARRKKQRMSVVISVLGDPGAGKTWFGIRLAEILDKKFDITRQCVFTREHFMKIISGEIKIKPGQVVVMDESHLQLGARHWWEKLQQDMVDQIATIRSMGIILIIVVLHMDMIDSIVRKFVLSYQLHMEERGKASIYSVSMPRWGSEAYHPKMCTLGVEVPGVDGCPSPECLWCPDRKKKEEGDGIRTSDRFLPEDEQCMNTRAVYERLKKAYLKETRDSAIRKAERAILADDPVSKEEFMFNLLYENKEHLKYTKKGLIDTSSIREIFSMTNRSIGRSSAIDLAKRLQWRYPELKPEPTEEKK